MKPVAYRSSPGRLWNTAPSERLGDMDTDQPPMAEALPDVDADLLERARAAAAGYPELEDVLRRLDAMSSAGDEIDVEHLPAEFDTIHRLLRAALGDVPS